MRIIAISAVPVKSILSVLSLGLYVFEFRDNTRVMSPPWSRLQPIYRGLQRF